jgi:hypothetical protein
MTIRRQILLYILPLFACFGVIGSAVAWRLQTEADKQVFDVMSASLVISFAEFITATDLEALAKDVPLADTALGRAVPRIDLVQYGMAPAKFTAATFRVRGWAWVDPTKEVAAYKEAVRAGFMTTGDTLGNDRVRWEVNEREVVVTVFDEPQPWPVD